MSSIGILCLSLYPCNCRLKRVGSLKCQKSELAKRRSGMLNGCSAAASLEWETAASADRWEAGKLAVLWGRWLHSAGHALHRSRPLELVAVQGAGDVSRAPEGCRVGRGLHRLLVAPLSFLLGLFRGDVEVAVVDLLHLEEAADGRRRGRAGPRVRAL